MQLGAIPGS